MASGKISIMVLAVVLMSLTSAQAQSPPDTSCLQSLIPCTNFLNSTKPPATCCDPLKKAFQTQLKCLCAAFANPALLAAANVNATVAAQLPINCGITADASMCTKGGQAPASAPMAMTPGASTGSSTPEAAQTPANAPGASPNAASSVGPVSSLVLLVVGFMLS